jgi:hypothetical protein
VFLSKGVCGVYLKTTRIVKNTIAGALSIRSTSTCSGRNKMEDLASQLEGRMIDVGGGKRQDWCLKGEGTEGGLGRWGRACDGTLLSY